MLILGLRTAVAAAVFRARFSRTLSSTSRCNRLVLPSKSRILFDTSADTHEAVLIAPALLYCWLQRAGYPEAHHATRYFILSRSTTYILKQGPQRAPVHRQRPRVRYLHDILSFRSKRHTTRQGVPNLTTQTHFEKTQCRQPRHSTVPKSPLRRIAPRQRERQRAKFVFQEAEIPSLAPNRPSRRHPPSRTDMFPQRT